MKGKAPSIFVSSTCYDLGQVRTNIKKFIEDLGYIPILSEYDYFPIDPNRDTVSNCIKVVNEQADIFVLIVGGRYGSKNEDGKSITNLEYLEAKAIGIPIYSFVQKSILDMLRIWRDNPNGNFSSVVDSTELFEFVDSLMNKENVWIFPFETAQDISKALKKQFANLFYDSLLIRNKFINVNLSKKLLELQGPGLRYIIEKPPYWELRLFKYLLVDGLKQAEDERRNLKYGIVSGKSISFNQITDFINWITLRIDDLVNISENLNNLLNVAFKEAMDKSNAELILYISNNIIEDYKKAIKWSLEFKLVKCEKKLQEILEISSKISIEVINKIELFINKFDEDLDKAIKDVYEGKDVVLENILELKEPKALEDFNKEIEKLINYYKV